MKLYPDDWKVRLSGAAGGMAGAAIGLFVLKPMIELPPGLGSFVFIALVGFGVVVGLLVGERLFRQSPGGPPDQRPQA